MENQNKIFFQVEAATNVGKRKNNQDVFLLNGTLPTSEEINDQQISLLHNNVNVLAVFDGMGGMPGAGDEAALLCAKQFNKVFSENRFEGIEQMKTLALTALDQSHSIVEEALWGNGGTTATVLLTYGEDYILLNVGDSPAFHIDTNGNITEISHRQNMAQYYKDKNEPYTEADASSLLFCVGLGWDAPSTIAHVCEGKISENEIILLCSDGITNYYDDALCDLAMDVKDIPLQEIVKKAIMLDYADNSTIISCKRLSDK